MVSLLPTSTLAQLTCFLVQNDLQFDFLGIKTFDLNHYDSPPLLQGCQQ